ncbi:3D domain-containing protein [Bdellovibrio sp. HCB185ZH]|uniref:3D domain-containing protein n=1 Tax=Bdellovibrio sp. HCB185ZH TaxID=3394235 RepID=UPI0039A6B7DC
MKSILTILVAILAGESAFALCPGNIATTTLYNMDGLSRQGCKTGRGKAGTCIIPFISIAADEDHNRMGTIISMPGMHGKKVKLPNGKIVSHPGYFLIEDTGGAVQGRNKFDFFVGNPPVNATSFGNVENQDVPLVDKTVCIDAKKFVKIPKYKPSEMKKREEDRMINPEYKRAVRKMEVFWKAAKLKRPDLEEVIQSAGPEAAPSSTRSGSGVQ